MHFTKMHGLGNDYLYIYGEVPKNIEELSKKCRRGISGQDRTEWFIFQNRKLLILRCEFSMQMEVKRKCAETALGVWENLCTTKVIRTKQI